MKFESQSLLTSAATRYEAERVAHFLLLGPQVAEGVFCWRNFAGNLFENFDPGIKQHASLCRIIGEKPNSRDTQFTQNRD